MSAPTTAARTVSNHEFLDAVFGNLQPNERIWATSFVEPPSKATNLQWAGRAVSDTKTVSDYMSLNAYFAVSTVRPDESGKTQRRKSAFVRMSCVVMDDAPPDEDASWVLQTSQGKHQVGYILASDITDVDEAEALQKALAAQNLVNADHNGYNPVRYVRLPQGANTNYGEPQPHKLLAWNPELTFSVDELAQKYGLRIDEKQAPTNQPSADHPSDRQTDAELINAIVTGKSYHDPLLKLSARYRHRGMSESDIVETIEGLMESVAVKDDRWDSRFTDIARTVRGAFEKFDARPEQIDRANHPLAKFVNHDEELQETDFVIEGLIQEGVVFIGGQEGVGKTTGFLPLMMAAAGFHEAGYEFGPTRPDRWRHVIYITEDIKQAQRVLMAVRKRLELTRAQVEERFHLVEAVRMGPLDFVAVKDKYMELVSSQSGADLLPVVVCDTKSAVFTIEDENDNAAASALIATLKQAFGGIPLIVIGHLAKTEITRTNAAQMSIRGAGAVGGDAHQTLFLVREGETRWLLRGKSRFESPYKELEIESYITTAAGVNRWGEVVEITVRAGFAKVPAAPRQSRDKDSEETIYTARTSILDAVQQYMDRGERINKTGLRAEVRMKENTVRDAADQLLNEHWLVEVEVPKAERVNFNKKLFLVRLAEDQREGYMKTGVLPDEVTWVPATWKKGARGN